MLPWLSSLGLLTTNIWSAEVVEASRSLTARFEVAQQKNICLPLLCFRENPFQVYRRQCIDMLFSWTSIMAEAKLQGLRSTINNIGDFNLPVVHSAEVAAAILPCQWFLWKHFVVFELKVNAFVTSLKLFKISPCGFVTAGRAADWWNENTFLFLELFRKKTSNQCS